MRIREGILPSRRSAQHHSYAQAPWLGTTYDLTTMKTYSTTQILVSKRDDSKCQELWHMKCGAFWAVLGMSWEGKG